MPRTSILIASATLTALATLSCVGDMAVKITGRFVDANNRIREHCTLTVTYRDDVISVSTVSGAFEEIVVFRPYSPDPLVVRGSCPGVREPVEKLIRRVPEKFGTPVDLGDFVLN